MIKPDEEEVKLNEVFDLSEKEIIIIDRALLAYTREIKEYDGRFGKPDVAWKDALDLHKKIRNLILNAQLKKDVSTRVIQ